MKLSIFVFRTLTMSVQLKSLIQTHFKATSHTSAASLSRQLRRYREHHRRGYANPQFNVVALLVDSTSTLGIPYLASPPAQGDTPLPHKN